MSNQSQPNLLLITVDQMRFDHLGLAGVQGISTPHLDRLGQEGVHFRRAYTPSPVCTPARVSLLTVLLGLVMMGIGLFFQSFKDLPLFELTLALAGLIGMPMTIPLVMALFIRRTPDWSGWGTVLAGTITSSLFWFGVPAEWIANLPLWGTPLDAAGTGDVRFALTLILTSTVCVAFFLFSTRFDPSEESAERALFFDRMRSAIQEDEISGDSVGAQAKLIGTLGLVYGVGVCAFAIFASTWNDRIPFLASGAIVVLSCGWLYFTGKREIARSMVRQPG